MEAEPSISAAMSMHDSVSIFKDHLRFSETQTKLDQRQDRWMGILQDSDQEKEYNSGGADESSQ